MKVYYSIDSDAYVFYCEDDKAPFCIDCYALDTLQDLVDEVCMYCDKHKLEPEDCVNPSLTERIQTNGRPWELRKSRPVEDLETLKEAFNIFGSPSWWESDTPEAYQAYYTLKNEFEKLSNRRLCKCLDGPREGDMVNIPNNKKRVILSPASGGYYKHVYQLNSDNNLVYLRDL